MTTPIIGEARVKITAEFEKLESSLAKDEPIIVGHAALLILAWLGEFLIGHHIISASSWSADENSLIPILTAILLAASASVMRRWVTPVEKTLTTAANDALDQAAKHVEALSVSAPAIGDPSPTVDQIKP